MPYFPGKKKRSLSERLSQLKGTSSQDASPRKNPSAPAGLDTLVNGSWITEDGCRVFYVRETIAPGTKHGALDLDAWLSGSAEALHILAKENRAAGLLPHEVFFLDTETTGLAGGTGTAAFLIGGLSVCEGSLTLHQLFMEDYSAEPLLLRKLFEIMASPRYLITFNGKTYDCELLKSRCGLHRLKHELEKPVHLDLLHASRRLWKEAFEDCRLATLEKKILGFTRGEDIEGRDIPQVYFDFLSDGDPRRIAQVFSHNRFDLLSLLALALKMNRIFTGREGEFGEAVAIGRIHFQRKETELALEEIAEYLEGRDAGEKDYETLRFYSGLLKCEGRWDEAVRIWEGMKAKKGVPDLFAFEELAKYYEHQARDYARALAVTEEALGRLKACGKFLPSMTAEMAKPLEHRRRRLLKKLARKRELPLSPAP